MYWDCTLTYYIILPMWFIFSLMNNHSAVVMTHDIFTSLCHLPSSWIFTNSQKPKLINYIGWIITSYMNCQEDVTLTCEILTDEYSFPSPSMQRKRAVAAPLMTTQPGSTGWISSRPAVQCSSELKIAPSHLQSLLWFIDKDHSLQLIKSVF